MISCAIFQYSGQNKLIGRAFLLKIGVVGKTGSGKSSLIRCLYRLTEYDGRIMIDGVDIKTLSLHGLRSSISAIAQVCTN